MDKIDQEALSEILAMANGGEEGADTLWVPRLALKLPTYPPGLVLKGCAETADTSTRAWPSAWLNV